MLLVRPQGLLGRRDMSRTDAAAPRRAIVALAIFVAVLLALPLFVSGYVVSVLIVVLFAAYFGQAWNIMMGFAGQLSLGHALYVGLGAYASAASSCAYGVPPWLGMIAGDGGRRARRQRRSPRSSFRFRVGGVYFALLTIAFAEFTRILFDHFDWVGGAERPVPAGDEPRRTTICCSCAARR